MVIRAWCSWLELVRLRDRFRAASVDLTLKSLWMSLFAEILLVARHDGLMVTLTWMVVP